MRSRLRATSVEDKDIYKLKSELQTIAPNFYLQSGLDTANSFEEIEDILTRNEKKLKEEVTKLESQAAKAKEALITELKARAIEKDAIKKETLKFFAEIGFDMFSQEETNKVFEWLNNNQAVRDSLGLNATFDIENGVLGYKGTFTDSRTLSYQCKRTFIQVFNKMLTGKEEYPA